MRVFREADGYIRNDFSFYDSGAMGALGPQIFALYDVMRRFVWRDAERGNPEIVELVKKGALPVRLSQQTLAEYTCLSRRTVLRLLPQMESLGWIERLKLSETSGKHACYVLGQRRSDDDGREIEVFYADAWMIKVWKHLEREATRRGKKRVVDLPVSERVEVIRAYLGTPTTGPSEGDSPSGPMRQPVTLNAPASHIECDTESLGECDRVSHRIPTLSGSQNSGLELEKEEVPMGRAPDGARRSAPTLGSLQLELNLSTSARRDSKWSQN